MKEKSGPDYPAVVNRKQRVGIFGGTFDPVHTGHTRIVELLLQKYSLDTILIIPVLVPPHKIQPCASYAHRVAMLEIAFSNTPDVTISLIEGERQKTSYTIETMHELQQRLGRQEFYLILGTDSFVELHLWYKFRRLLCEANFIIAARPGLPMGPGGKPFMT